MRSHLLLATVALTLALAGCGASDDHPPVDPGSNDPDAGTGGNPSTAKPDPSPGKLPPQLAAPGTLPTDDLDADGIHDALEDYLATGFAPELRFAPEDTALPASVAWYLPKVRMRFSHKNATDEDVLVQGTVTAENLAGQTHYFGNKNIWPLWDHTDVLARSAKRYSEDAPDNVDWKEVFFLQPSDDTVHAGSAQSEWTAYVHVKPSQYSGAAYDLQYWYFFPYNDATATINHEGDWEHVTVTVDAQLKFLKIFYSQHSGGENVTSASKLYWVEESHPVVYIAQGTHASYATVGAFDTEVIGIKDNTYDGGPKWQTWTKLINVGEKEKPLNGQKWIQYGGRWGEIGELKDTSGPYGPAFSGDWETY